MLKQGTGADLEWFSWEVSTLLEKFSRLMSRTQTRARQRLLQLPARLIANSLVEGQRVRLRGRVVLPQLPPPDQLVRMVEGGGELPDFTLVLDDGVEVKVAAADAGVSEKLRLLDLWEDRQTHATCGSRTEALFRQSRFRPGGTVEICGVARRAPVFEAQSGRGRWTLEADDALVVLFVGQPPARGSG
jgi:hypothetical protein